jgi:hypothetical protein
VRIGPLTGISGVDFAVCHARRIDTVLDGVHASIISRDDLVASKVAREAREGPQRHDAPVRAQAYIMRA